MLLQAAQALAATADPIQTTVGSSYLLEYILIQFRFTPAVPFVGVFYTLRSGA
jgi:hypothetical protein